MKFKVGDTVQVKEKFRTGPGYPGVPSFSTATVRSYYDDTAVFLDRALKGFRYWNEKDLEKI